MQKLLRPIINILSSLVVLLLTAVIVLITQVNPNDFKPQVTERFHAATGKYLALNGDLQWSFFPWVALQANDVKISKDNSHKQLIAQIEQAKIQIKLLPLFKKEVAIDALKISSLKLISGAKQRVYNVTDLKLKSDPIKFNQPFAFHLKFALLSDAPKIHGDFKLSGEITLDKNKLENWKTQGTLLGTQLQFEKITAKKFELQFSVQNGSTLNGNGRFALNNGVLQGADIRYWINTADALKNKQPIPQINSHQSEFGDITGTFVITNDIYSNQDFLLLTKDARASGKGTINLDNQQINFQLLLQHMSNGQPKEPTVPMTITGTLSNPNFQINVQKILDQQLKDKIKVRLSEKLQKSLGKSLGDEISKQLNNFIH